ncbi:uncharacterized protein LOC125140861 [Tachysurus fulvidraco]|uniref:uncharacterized protein LOC125140861 n=1 Tax=Tachysurus fulvidraco TaxID=1234273 RepID=UPI001FEE846B|nr:uncharacterized protein LOC125140861 [Tachysurus fulvidraco]
MLAVFFSSVEAVSQENKMLYSYFLIFLFQLICTGGCLVFQSSSMTVEVETNVTLVCDISNAFGQCSSVRWLLYHQENGLKIYILGIRTINRKAEQDTLCRLQITKVRLSDNGTFYCLLLNEGVDFMGNGTALTVLAPDITSKQKVNTYDHKTNLEQVHEHQCLVPIAVLGGISLLIFLGILALFAYHRRAILMHRRDNNVSQNHQQSFSETLYATLMFVTRRHERAA